MTYSLTAYKEQSKNITISGVYSWQYLFNELCLFVYIFINIYLTSERQKVKIDKTSDIRKLQRKNGGIFENHAECQYILWSRPFFWHSNVSSF